MMLKFTGKIVKLEKNNFRAREKKRNFFKKYSRVVVYAPSSGARPVAKYSNPLTMTGDCYSIKLGFIALK